MKGHENRSEQSRWHLNVRKYLKMWMDRCHIWCHMFSYLSGCTHISGFTRAVMWRSGVAARMEALFELGGCWTTVSLLLPAGALRQKLWSLALVLLWCESAWWWLVCCDLFTIQTVASCDFHDVAMLYFLLVQPNNWPFSSKMFWVVYKWMRLCTWSVFIRHFQRRSSLLS